MIQKKIVEEKKKKNKMRIAHNHTACSHHRFDTITLSPIHTSHSHFLVLHPDHIDDFWSYLVGKLKL